MPDEHPLQEELEQIIARLQRLRDATAHALDMPPGDPPSTAVVHRADPDPASPPVLFTKTSPPG